MTVKKSEIQSRVVAAHQRVSIAYRRTSAPQPKLEPIQKSKVARIYFEIERAWLRLMNVKRPVSLRLTESGSIIGFSLSDPKMGEPIGTYSRNVPLASFREDVLFVWSEIKGPNEVHV